MGSVFISYRREDSEGQARALFQDLVARLGRDSVFMDVDSIGLGRDFREVLQERLATCDLMLALIGRDWLDGKDKSGRRRLDNAGDYVRLEIAAALKRNIPVTPLLLHGAQMPSAEQLPADLADLAYRNGFELSHNRWDSDVQELCKRLGLVPRDDSASRQKTASPTAIQPTPKQAWLPIAATAAVTLALAVGGFWYYENKAREKLRADKSTAQLESVTEPQGKAKPPLATADRERRPTNSLDPRARRERNYTFDSADFQLQISSEGRYMSRPFTVDGLDPSKDFWLNFQIKSHRNGGSTRYGIAWDYTPDDFLLFTLHSMPNGYYSIGPGRSRRYAPFSRFSEGAIRINGEKEFDALQMTRNGDALIFAINGQEVWRSDKYPLRSNQFAFWVADFSEASIRSYTLRQ